MKTKAFKLVIKYANGSLSQNLPVFATDILAAYKAAAKIAAELGGTIWNLK